MEMLGIILNSADQRFLFQITEKCKNYLLQMLLSHTKFLLLKKLFYCYALALQPLKAHALIYIRNSFLIYKINQLILCSLIIIWY